MSHTFFPWKAEYSVGIPEIDEQHKAITAMLNTLYEAFMKNEHDVRIGGIVEGLASYARYHFGTEERYFTIYGYADRIEHMKEHAEFIAKVEEFKNDFNAQKRALTFKVINFLRDWLIQHILVEDRKYISCLAERRTMV
jgi:hemerythrin-like metal-binding protein